MPYKSKDKFLEKNGKTWSYCHVDPALGKACAVHASHVSAKDFAKTLTAAAHGFEDNETENDIMDIFDTEEDLDLSELTREELNAVSDLLFGHVDRKTPISASSLIRPAPTDGYFVFFEDSSSPIYANLSLEEARAKAEMHSSTRTDGKVYIVSRFNEQGHRDTEFEAKEKSETAEISSKYNIDEPERLVGQAIGKLVATETDGTVNASEAIKTLTLTLREMKDLVVFRPVKFKEQILLAHSVMDGSFFNSK